MNTKLFIIITVDTESSDSPQAIRRTDLLKPMFYGQFEGSYYGFPRIIEICERFTCKATFFVSVFEFRKYDGDGLREVCREIKQKGHDVQLHTHPIWTYEKRHMYDNSLEEQVRIIQEGKELLERWTGDSPIAHRAGVYGADENTLRALKQNDIPIDSSNFYGHETCKLAVTKNRVVERQEIVEVPVTFFKRRKETGLGPAKLKLVENFIKTDVDWASLDELLWFAEQAKLHNLKVMTLFLHSYSFIKFDSNFTHFEPDYEDAEKFEKFLAVVTKDPEIEIVTMKQFYELYRSDPEYFTRASDYVPVKAEPVTISEAARKGLNRFKARAQKVGING
ncbi:MAG: polysaccharide deacetylase family protein [Chloroflexi bacterium]|nr:polysaccharide deacetylase family protein [Chloroflexota bacterium]